MNSRTRWRRPAIAAILLAIAGCSSAPAPLRTPPPPVSLPQTDQQAGLARVAWEDGLTLDEAVAVAMRKNPALMAARERHGIAQALHTQAGVYPFNPEVSVGGASDAAFRDHGESGLAAELAQTFETGGQRGHRRAVAEAEGRRIGWEVLDVERTTREELVSTFYRVLVLERKADLVDQALELARKLEEISEKRVKAGDLPALEANVSKIEVQRALKARTEARTALRRERFALCRLLGEPPREDVKLVGDIAAAEPGPGGDLAVRALESRPDVLAARAAVESAERSVGLARSQRAPDVMLSAQYERERSVDDEVADVAEFFGGALTVPLPLWNRQQGEIAQAGAEAAVARALVASIERDVIAQVASADERLRLAREIVDLYEKDLIPLVKSNLDLNEKAFSAGQVSTLLLLKAQQDYIETNSAYLDALGELHEARAAIDAAVGAGVR